MNKEASITITAIVCVTALEAMAIWKGLDGALFGFVVAVVAGLAGYQVKAYINKKKEKNGE